MKKLLLLISITFSIQANAQWVQQTSGTSVNLSSIFFPTPVKGYSLQDDGLMNKTSNGGSNWGIASTYQSMVGQLFFTSADTGFATSASGVRKTVNGGISWQNNFPDSVNILSIHFPTSNIGYALGTNLTYDTLYIYKTINGGNSWFSVYTQLSSGYPTYVFFTDPSTGFISLSDGIYKTTDGGVTLTKKSIATIINCIHFPSANVGYAVGDSLFKTVDAGETWTIQANPNSALFFSTYFLNDNYGYACGGNNWNSGLIEKTVDGGVNWTIDLSSIQIIHSLSFPNSNTGYACGTGGVIYKLTTSNGITEALDATTLTLSPNPVSNQLTVSSQKATLKEIKIMNSLGQCMLTSTPLGGGSEGHVDMSSLANGIYFVQLTDENKNVINKKIIKE